MPEHPLLQAALDLARAGLAPVPMYAARKCPALKGWRARTSLDDEAIRAAFATAPHADAIGIAAGGGLFVVDLDRNHGNGADGIAEFAKLVARLGAGLPLKPGPRVRTPRGGLHVYFASPSGLRIRNRTGLAPGVDVRGEGGVVMAPPSVRAGIAYRWGPDPWRQPLVEAPGWLLRLVAPDELPTRLSSTLKPVSGNVHPYARAAMEHECTAVATCGPGGRIAALFKAAASLGALAAGGALPVREVANALTRAATACGLVADDGTKAVEATIASGLTHGLRSPRTVPEVRR